MHTGIMENNQDFQQISSSTSTTHRTARSTSKSRTLDTDCGRIRTESFDDAAAADRFASRCVVGEDGWAVVDAIPGKVRRAAA